MWEFIMGLGAPVWALLASTAGIILLLLGVRKSGADAQRAKDQEIQIEQSIDVSGKISDAQDAGNRVSTDVHSNPDRLREDDGHRRD